MERKHEATRHGANANPTLANDAALLQLEQQFNVVAGELSKLLESYGARIVEARLDCEPGWPKPALESASDDMADRLAAERLVQLEAVLGQLAPIEQAIMTTPAQTIIGLGVKARHAAYVLSEYWEEPMEKSDWDRRAVRLFIEAVCQVAGRPLPRSTT